MKKALICILTALIVLLGSTTGFAFEWQGMEYREMIGLERDGVPNLGCEEVVILVVDSFEDGYFGNVNDKFHNNLSHGDLVMHKLDYLQPNATVLGYDVSDQEGIRGVLETLDVDIINISMASYTPEAAENHFSFVDDFDGVVLVGAGNDPALYNYIGGIHIGGMNILYDQYSGEEVFNWKGDERFDVVCEYAERVPFLVGNQVDTKFFSGTSNATPKATAILSSYITDFISRHGEKPTVAQQKLFVTFPDRLTAWYVNNDPQFIEEFNNQSELDMWLDK